MVRKQGIKRIYSFCWRGLLSAFLLGFPQYKPSVMRLIQPCFSWVPFPFWGGSSCLLWTKCVSYLKSVSLWTEGKGAAHERIHYPNATSYWSSSSSWSACLTIFFWSLMFMSASVACLLDFHNTRSTSVSCNAKRQLGGQQPHLHRLPQTHFKF